METTICSRCGAVLQPDKTCQDDFYQMLYWEAEDPSRGIVHHLMVLCYHLQHPHLYSPEGIATGKELLISFVEQGLAPEIVRQREREAVNSKNRDWKITARPGQIGKYEHPVKWTMTAMDVVANGADAYLVSVRTWAQAVLDDLKMSGNIG